MRLSGKEVALPGYVVQVLHTHTHAEITTVWTVIRNNGKLQGIGCCGVTHSDMYVLVVVARNAQITL